MKSVLLPVQPKWTKKILDRQKTIEVRKSAPTPPFKAYIYCTKGKSNSRLYKEANADGYFLDREGWRGGDYEKRYLCGKVVAEFVCESVIKFCYETTIFNLKIDSDTKKLTSGDSVEATPYYNVPVYALKNSLLTQQELVAYGKGKTLYGWCISDLKIYDTPLELKNFYRPLPRKDLDEGNYDLDCLGEVACMDSPEGGEYCAGCEYGGAKPITRPPQSWMYAKEARK